MAKRVCAFCGGSPVTAEHVFADWISTLFPKIRTGMSHLGLVGGEVLRYPMAFLDQTVRCVCARCNNGWMKEIEEEARPILTPMLKSRLSIPLSTEYQTSLSTWAFKTVLMFQYLHSSVRPIPQVEYDLFYAEKEPPENCVVWIAHRSVIEENRARPGHQLTAAAAINVLDAVKAKASDSKERIEQLPSAGTIVVATFVITRVAFQLLWHDLLGPLPLQRTTRDVYRCIWPAAERNAIWPPPAGIEDVGGFYGFHAALVDAVMAS